MKDEVIRKADSLPYGSDTDHCFGKYCSLKENCIRYLLHVRDSRRDKDKPHFYIVQEKECKLFKPYKTKSSIYVSIPISGLPLNLVKRRAKEVKLSLAATGVTVFTPFDVASEKDIRKGMTEKEKYAFFMGRDIECLLNCDAVFFCCGWKYSNGCRTEYEIARIYGKEMIFESEINMKQMNFLWKQEKE